MTSMMLSVELVKIYIILGMNEFLFSFTMIDSPYMNLFAVYIIRCQ